MILTLERKGLISRTAGVARSITRRVAPAELPPLERSQQQSQAERQRAGLAAAKSRQRVDGARRKSPLSSSSTRVAANDRAAEYVDSPMMTQRLRFGRSASARIAGRYGDYRTKVRVIGKQEDTCTCPSDSLPCKHARALRATWRTNPRSVFDVDAFIRSIASMEKADLIGTISEIVIAFPQTLGLFGIAGFDEDGDEDDVVDEPMD
jgi:hypothetical protein